MARTIAILTSGGDSPGMNAAIRAATMVAVAKGHRMLGVRHGYKGLLDGKIGPIGTKDVNSILREGGTILYSARSRRFHDAAERAHAREILTQHGVDGLIAIGGNGTLTGLTLLSDRLKTLVDAKLCEATGEEHEDIETRVTVLGHVVRGGRPSAFDRLLGSRFGNVAVRAILAGEHRKIVSWLPPMNLPEGAGARSPADPYCYLLDLPTVLAATRQLIDGQSPLARWRATAFDDLEDVFLL